MHQSTGIRVLFAGPYWPGANSLYIGRAFQQCGAIIYWLNDSGYLPGWSTRPGRALRRLSKPLIDVEWNRELLKAVDLFQPHLVYITMGTHIAGKTLLKLKERSIPTMCFYHDVVWKEKPLNRFAENIHHFDLVATTRHWQVEAFKQAGAKDVIVTRFGYDPTAHQPLVVNEAVYQTYGAQIGFIGTQENKRSKDIEALVAHDFPYTFRLWGNGWDRLSLESSVLRYWQKRGVYEPEIPIIYATSKVALHWLGWEPDSSNAAMRMGDQHNSRTFQIAACGGAIMVAQRTEEHLAFFEEDVEAVYFDNVDELRDKLAFWLAPRQDTARQRMAAAALSRCRKEDYTYVPVVKRFLEHFNLNQGSRS